jgi:aspartate/methionine/tyrosine aminotransferase
MKHRSLYLDWYNNVPQLKYNFMSSGICNLSHTLVLENLDLSANFHHGNPEATARLSKIYNVNSENLFLSSEGASGQNARIIRFLAEKYPKKNEAIIECPTYEPLLRQVQEHFNHVKRLDRTEEESYALNLDKLEKTVTERTGLLVITNPHAPSGAVSLKRELKEVMEIAREHYFYVLCDEIYGEFDRKSFSTLFSIDTERSIVTTSFTKAYGLGGLKLGVAITQKNLVDELYGDVLNTVGNSPNIVQVIAAELLSKNLEKLENHKQKWTKMKEQTQQWLKENNMEFFPSKYGVTLWVKTLVPDTYEWTNKVTIPKYSLAAVPGAFFYFRNDNKLTRTDRIRLSLGNISPDGESLIEGLNCMKTSMKTRAAS